MPCIRLAEEYLFLAIKVTAGASKSELGEIQEGRLKVRIAAAPEHGKANEELCSFFAKILELPKREVTLESGGKSRLKIIRLPAAVKEKLEKLIPLGFL